MLRAGLIGFGGIATSHRKAFYELKKLGVVELVCAYDINPEAFTRRATINISEEEGSVDENLHFYTDLDEMLAKEDIDLVDICIPTFIHADMTIDMLNRGYHVLCEKPMALNYADCQRMIEAANRADRKLMIGQCLRFYPSVDYVKEIIDSKKFGEPLGGYFSRISPPPVWGWENWFMNPERSGGCLTDMHIHDIDLIRYLFGEPEAVSCRTSSSVCVHDNAHTVMYYGGIPITAIGDWTLTGCKFSQEFRISLEGATIIFSGGALTVYPKNGDPSYEVELSKASGQFGELLYLCKTISGEIENTKNTPESAATTVKIIDLLRESAELGGEIIKNK